jgi:Domain of unknown function (DUF4188)
VPGSRGNRGHFLRRASVAVQYWRDFDSLDRFARDTGPAAPRTVTAVQPRGQGPGDIGIWHETFKIRSDEYEAIYGNMPVFGLAFTSR